MIGTKKYLLDLNTYWIGISKEQWNSSWTLTCNSGEARGSLVSGKLGIKTQKEVTREETDPVPNTGNLPKEYLSWEWVNL